MNFIYPTSLALNEELVDETPNKSKKKFKKRTKKNFSAFNFIQKNDLLGQQIIIVSFVEENASGYFRIL